MTDQLKGQWSNQALVELERMLSAQKDNLYVIRLKLSEAEAQSNKLDNQLITLRQELIAEQNHPYALLVDRATAVELLERLADS